MCDDLDLVNKRQHDSLPNRCCYVSLAIQLAVTVHAFTLTFICDSVYRCRSFAWKINKQTYWFIASHTLCFVFHSRFSSEYWSIAAWNYRPTPASRQTQRPFWMSKSILIVCHRARLSQFGGNNNCVIYFSVSWKTLCWCVMKVSTSSNFKCILKWAPSIQLQAVVSHTTTGRDSNKSFVANWNTRLIDRDLRESTDRPLWPNVFWFGPTKADG